MSEKAQQNAPERCSCCTCGYTWVKGQHGGHSCAQVMEVTVADLRARLSKYEDAEGRPVVTGDHPGLISALREMSNHVFNREHRLIVAAADALEYQAREIEVLEYSSRHNYECVQTLIDEKAALKAQPRGVVLPERISIAGHLTVDSSYRASGWNACLDEVARLNSSPVSAGGVDERAALPDRYTSPDYCKALERERDYLKQLSVKADREHQMLSNEVVRLRRALADTAPSHGEQVREGWKLVPVEPTPAMLDVAVSFALNVSLSGEYNWSSYMRDVWLRMLAATPSAGSQGGDV